MQPGISFCVHKCCSIAGNVNTTLLQSGRVPDPGTNFGPAFNCMLSGIIRVYRCTSYDKLVRPCSFGSLFLWINSGHQLICCTDQTDMLKVVCSGQLCLRLTLYYWQQSSRCAFHVYNTRIHA